MSRKQLLGKKKRQMILDQVDLLDLSDVILLTEEFDHAIIGLVDLNVSNRITSDHDRAAAEARMDVCGITVVAYSTKAILEALVDDGMSLEDAREHFEFNISGSWIGPTTPIYVQDELDLSLVDL